jgi:hypothetical protein
MFEVAVLPKQGLGQLRLNMPRAVVRDLLPERAEVSELGPAVDVFDDLGLHVHYDTADLVEYLECHPPCRATLDGLDLLTTPWRELKVLLEERGHTWWLDERTGSDIELTDEQVVFNVQDEEEPPVVVGVFRAGYYD